MATRKTPKRKPARRRTMADKLNRTLRTTGRGRAERLHGSMGRIRSAAEQVVNETSQMFFDREAVSRVRAFANDILLDIEVYEEVNWP